MKLRTDRDGKSKTASAVDSEHYPEQHEVDDPAFTAAPTREEISLRAWELWQEHGCPNGSADSDWLEAERELAALADSRNVLNSGPAAGSVQR